MMLSVRNISKAFGGVKAVDDVSFEADKGRITSLIGPNGAGKTTLFNLVGGFLSADSGTVSFEGRSVGALAPFMRARLGIGRTFQHVQLMSDATVLENVMVGLHQSGQAGIAGTVFRSASFRREDARILAQAKEALEMGQIGHLADELVERLPYGLQRRVEVARAVAMHPRLLLMDEPAAGLNDRETEELGHQIGALRDAGVAILLVEHAMALVMGISDHVVVLEHGRKLAEGSVDTVRNDARVIEAYLGVEQT